MAFSSVSRKNCYMMSAGDLQQRYADANQEMSSKRATPGLVIGCYIDTATGTLSFTVNGKEVANKFQVKAAFWRFVFFFVLFLCFQLHCQWQGDGQQIPGESCFLVLHVLFMLLFVNGTNWSLAEVGKLLSRVCYKYNMLWTWHGLSP